MDPGAYMDRVRSPLFFFSGSSDECDSCLSIADVSGRRVVRVMGGNIASDRRVLWVK